MTLTGCQRQAVEAISDAILASYAEVAVRNCYTLSVTLAAARWERAHREKLRLSTVSEWSWQYRRCMVSERQHSAYPTTSMILPLHCGCHVTLHIVQTARYRSLALKDLVFPFWIASHVREGLVETQTGGIRQIVRPGDVMLHPPHVAFGESASGCGTHEWMGFEVFVGNEEDGMLTAAQEGWDLLARFPVGLVVTLRNDRQAQYISTFHALESAWLAATRNPNGDSAVFAARALQTTGLVTLLVGELIGAWVDQGAVPRPSAAQTSRDRFSGLIRYMAKNMSCRITRDELAAQAFLHPASLDRAFRAACGLPPLRLLQRMRLDRARHLLRTTDDTLETIAHACGMGDATCFGRTFRAHYGKSPGVWRTASRADPTMIRYIPTLSPTGEDS